MTQRLFKYATAETAEKILCNRSLRRSAPETFNDPFEFKSPFELGFEWDEFERCYLDEIARIVTQPNEPELVEENPVAGMVKAARTVCKGQTPEQARQKFSPQLPALINKIRSWSESDRETWRLKKKEYRVLCLSEVPDNILMWSHYAKNHQGVVLAFELRFDLIAELMAVARVVYLRQVPNAASLKEYVGYLTGQRRKPKAENAFVKAVFTKSSDWAYENEWRLLAKDTRAGAELIGDRPFDATELVGIYFGCRAFEKSKVELIAIAKTFGTPISFFEMRDERIRFELTPVSMQT